MQTFLTEKSNDNSSLLEVCMRTAQSLDNARLGKQRVEAKQIFLNSFPHHPATKMWRGYFSGLASYGHAMCVEWEFRGFEDNLRPYFADQYDIMSISWPWWFGNREMARSHRSKLLNKNYKHYSQFDWDFSQGHDLYTKPLPYIWPDPDQEGIWRVSAAEAARQDEWYLPSNWHYDPRTRIVVFDAPVCGTTTREEMQFHAH